MFWNEDPLIGSLFVSGVKEPKRPATLRPVDAGTAIFNSITTFIVLIEPFFDVD